MSLPRLNFVRNCAKCGQHTTDAPMDYGFGGVMTTGAGISTILDEYIERTCRRCSYRWKEAPLDA